MPDLVLYDGACGLCHRSVAFLARHDGDGRLFHFAPLGGETARTRLGDAAALGSGPDATVIVLADDGRLLVRGDAVLHALSRLGPGWRLLAWGTRLVPRPLRDGAYSVVARLRVRLFARPPAACPRVPASLLDRFLP